MQLPATIACANSQDTANFKTLEVYVATWQQLQGPQSFERKHPPVLGEADGAGRALLPGRSAPGLVGRVAADPSLGPTGHPAGPGPGRALRLPR